MYFTSWSEFFAMGGHGFYVWMAYGLMALSFSALIIGSRLNQRRWLALQRRRRHIAQTHFSGKSTANSPAQER